MTRMIGLGAGGHATVVIDILRHDASNELVGLLDSNRALHGTEVAGVPVLGGDDLLQGLRSNGVTHAFIGLGCSGDARPRARLYTAAVAAGFEPVAAIHPKATVSSAARLGRGATIMPGAIVNAGARLGDNVIVNSGAIVEHDCAIGHHAHIATGASLASAVEVGEGAHIGVGAAIRQCIRIGRYAQVGAGAVVVRDVAEGVIVVGVPARVLKAVQA
ncbi:MAG: acetyltransferase [Longimicrobiales bacterium]